MNKAIFLDRDKTLIEDVPYLCDPEKVVLLPGIKDVLQKLRAAGYLLFLFTNQSGIGRGLFSEKDAVKCNQRMINLIGLGNDIFQEICIAPEHPEDPPVYRKPSPKFILEMNEKYDLSKSESWMVGDKEIDYEAGIRAGIQSARIGNGNNKNTFPSLVEFSHFVVF